jgi:hypothetical protein
MGITGYLPWKRNGRTRPIAPGPVRRSSRLHWCCKAGVRSVLTRRESMRRWLRPISALVGLRNLNWSDQDCSHCGERASGACRQTEGILGKRYDTILGGCRTKRGSVSSECGRAPQLHESDRCPVCACLGCTRFFHSAPLRALVGAGGRPQGRATRAEHVPLCLSFSDDSISSSGPHRTLRGQEPRSSGGKTTTSLSGCARKGTGEF